VKNLGPDDKVKKMLRKDSRSTEMMLKTSIVFFLVASAFFPPFVVALNIDPLHQLFKSLVGHSVESIAIKILLLLLYYFDLIENINYLLGFVMHGIIGILATNRLLVSIWKNPKNPKRLIFNCKYRQLYFYCSIYTFNGLRILWKNEFYTWFVLHIPYVSICLGICVAVVFNCGTIKLVNTVMMPFYLMMPAGSLIAALVLFFLLGYACEIHEQSCAALIKLETMAVSKYEKKYVKSLPPFGCPFGRFLVLRKSNRLTFFDAVPNYTFNLLLMLK